MGVITIVTGLANHSNSSNHLLNSTILQVGFAADSVKNHGGRPDTCAADGARRGARRARAVKRKVASTKRQGHATRQTEARRGEAQSDAQKRDAERGKSGGRESDIAKRGLSRGGHGAAAAIRR